MQPSTQDADKTKYAGYAAIAGTLFSKVSRTQPGLSLIPPYVVERWWRERERRQDERLLVLPE